MYAFKLLVEFSFLAFHHDVIHGLISLATVADWIVLEHPFV
jgi:hypothetical protein